ncbi:TetR/AcrR family transcriptional regulator [Bifidobacterium cuniculi]|uniref:TetR family transcriptional regulator n=1 Tax=Bifidobacterium cuniculi TaxID=1688 RepID=A0A087AVY2_9BIFI|nr:TetR-like C-terminal domain-containing protein [Bifidobacterium cuniculi]KFI62932.1 TetR family transcriptional regulator [Bifidobacterium cuniculi]
MPPRKRHNAQDILDGALSIVRESGPDALTARSLAQRLGCSVKPIFDAFGSMEGVHHAVWKRAQELYAGRVRQAVESGAYPPYQASGMAYIGFAHDEPQLFRMRFMRPITQEERRTQAHDLEPVIDVLADQLGIDHEEAERFHLEVWVGVHGLASMIATGYLDLDQAFVNRSVDDLYLALRDYHIKEGHRG